MTALAGETQSTIGARVAAARRSRGMTQRDLAQTLGISTWTVDRIERGAVDVGRYLSLIAEVTHASRDWFVGSNDGATPSRPRVTVLPHLGVAGKNLVLGSIILLVTIRFFTEVVSVVPRALNFVDIPIFLALALAAACVPAGSHPGRAYFRVGVPASAFMFLAIVSAIVNANRADPAPVLVFIYGFLAPLGVYAASYRIWPAGNARSLSRVLVALGLLQIAVVVSVSLPRFIASDRNPDEISGTFGTNAYQLVFFLLVVASLLVGIFVLEPSRLVAPFVPLIIVAIFAVILLAQYRALFATFVVTLAAVGLLLGIRPRGIAIGALVFVAFVLTFSYVSSTFPGLKLEATASTLSQNPWSYVKQRYEATGPVAQLYRDQALAPAIGVGPGTFSSRAWQTFANADSTSQSNVVGGYAQFLAGGTTYKTDVSEKYIRSYKKNAVTVEGSRAVTNPHSSYLGLAAEVGLVALALVVGVYVAALVHSTRLTRQTIRRAAEYDSVPALALATTVGFLTLLQMGFLENWLEVTRATFLVWMMFGVLLKEVDVRSVGSA